MKKSKKEESAENKRKKIILIILIFIVFILAFILLIRYLVIWREEVYLPVPSTNGEIYEVECNGENCYLTGDENENETGQTEEKQDNDQSNATDVNSNNVVYRIDNSNTVNNAVDDDITNSDNGNNTDGRLEIGSPTKLNIFANETDEGAVIEPGSHGWHDFVIRNNGDGRYKYKLAFIEDSDYLKSMVYRLKKNGKYIAGNDDTWVNYIGLNQADTEIAERKADYYELEWWWSHSDNDNLVGQLQDQYSLSIILQSKEENR